MVPVPGRAPQPCEQLQLPSPFYPIHLPLRGGQPPLPAASALCQGCGTGAGLGVLGQSCLRLQCHPGEQCCSSNQQAGHPAWTLPVPWVKPASKPQQFWGQTRHPRSKQPPRSQHPLLWHKQGSQPWAPGWSRSSPAPAMPCLLVQTAAGAVSTSWTAASQSGASFLLPKRLLVPLSPPALHAVPCH